MEYGCGVGNTILPLMKTHPRAQFIATDFSPTAIRLLQVPVHQFGLPILKRLIVSLFNPPKTHPEFEASRCKTFVSDLTQGDLPKMIPPDSVDIVLLVFVLSALAPGTVSQR